MPPARLSRRIRRLFDKGSVSSPSTSSQPPTPPRSFPACLLQECSPRTTPRSPGVCCPIPTGATRVYLKIPGDLDGAGRAEAGRAAERRGALKLEGFSVGLEGREIRKSEEVGGNETALWRSVNVLRSQAKAEKSFGRGGAL